MMTDSAFVIPPQPARRRRHFYTLDTNGDAIAWRMKHYAKAWRDLAPSSRQIVEALHPAIRRAGRQDTLIEALPGSAPHTEAKAYLRSIQLAPPPLMP